MVREIVTYACDKGIDPFNRLPHGIDILKGLCERSYHARNRILNAQSLRTSFIGPSELTFLVWVCTTESITLTLVLVVVPLTFKSHLHSRWAYWYA